jgi:hypothetical protein
LIELLTLAAMVATAASCGDSSTGPGNSNLDPANFVTSVTNPLFPLTPGTVFNFEGESGDEAETNTIEVLSETKTILGISATIVHDRVYTEGDLTEDTFDWYAQDKDGNVWYLGEDSRELENGQVVSTEGSWEAGVDGAEAGIIMWGDPAAHLGEEYHQEFARGVAEDLGKVVALDQTVDVPYGSFSGCIKTEDRNALEPGVLENKYYCPGIGVTLELGAQGSSHRNELVSVTGP